MQDEDDLPDHLFRLLEEGSRGFREEFRAVLAEEDVHLALSGSRARVLQLVPRSGARQVDLAARARMTKQSLGEILAALEEEGMIRRTPDPDDGRAWTVVPTRRGLALSARIDELARRAEERVAARVGAAEFETFRSVLTRLAEGAR